MGILRWTLIISSGFLSWGLKGFKTNLKKEILGSPESSNYTQTKNLLVGLLVFIMIVIVALLI